jgi:membrane-associated phospholipid phosphatase
MPVAAPPTARRARGAAVRAVPAAVGALGCALLLALAGLLALAVPGVKDADITAMRSFASLDRPSTDWLLNAVAHLCDPLPYCLMGLVLVLVAAVRRRWALVALLPILLVVTELTTQGLKHALATPRLVSWLTYGPAPTAWPSGHTTAAMTLALAAVLVAPRARRPLVAVAGGALAVAVGVAVVALHWHFPSDVVGGYLVAATWALAATAALRALEPDVARAPAGAWRSAGALVAGGALAALAVGGAVLLARPGTGDVLGRPAWIAAATAIVALAALLPLGTSRVVEG